MILKLKEDLAIENLLNYSEETVEKLRKLLADGAEATLDPHRHNFYDVQNGSRTFFIHVCPSGKVLLLATWLKDDRANTAPQIEPVAA